VRLQWQSGGSHARPGRAFLWAARGKAVRTASSCRHVRGMGMAWRCAWTEYGGDATGRAAAWSARRHLCARGTWRKGRGPGRWFSTGGPTARGQADDSRPRRPGPARGAGARSGACRRATSRRSAFRRGNILGLPCSTTVFSKKLN
jgi:hypothetical protein